MMISIIWFIIYLFYKFSRISNDEYIEYFLNSLFSVRVSVRVPVTEYALLYDVRVVDEFRNERRYIIWDFSMQEEYIYINKILFEFNHNF